MIGFDRKFVGVGGVPACWHTELVEVICCQAGNVKPKKGSLSYHDDRVRYEQVARLQFGIHEVVLFNVLFGFAFKKVITSANVSFWIDMEASPSDINVTFSGSFRSIIRQNIIC